MSINTGPFRYAVSHTAACAGTFKEILSITGNQTTNVHVVSIGASAIQTVDTFNVFRVYSRSDANTGGTAVNLDGDAFNSNYPSASAVVSFYTVPPTYGAAENKIWDGWIMCNDDTPTNDVAGFSGATINFVDLYGAPIDLLDSDQSIGIGLEDIAAPAGFTFSAWVAWYETLKS